MGWALRPEYRAFMFFYRGKSCSGSSNTDWQGTKRHVWERSLNTYLIKNATQKHSPGGSQMFKPAFLPWLIHHLHLRKLLGSFAEHETWHLSLHWAASQSAPSPYWCGWLFHPRCKALALHLLWLKLMRFLSPHFSSLFMSLQIAALPSSILNPSPNLTVRAHSPTIPIVNEDIKLHWYQYWSLRDHSLRLCQQAQRPVRPGVK